MNVRNFLVLLAIGLFLICVCIVISASAVATDEQIHTYARYDPNITYSINCTPLMNVTTVNPNDEVLVGSCVDLRIVEGWYGRLAHESGKPIVDVSAYTRTILINPEIWIPGSYFQWAEFEEEHGNLYMFTVVTEETTKEEVEVFTQNVSVANFSALVKFEYNLPEMVVGDILVAREDPLSYNNSWITNQTKVWFFGVQDRLYDVPCLNGQLIVNASLIQSLRPGMYYVLFDNPGQNTIPEAVWNEEKERVESPLRITPYLEVPGYDPRTVYEKIVPWLRQYSDDQLIVQKMELQEPYVDIRGIETVYSNRTDVLQVDGYTNLAVGTKVYAVIDEIYGLRDTLVVPRTYDVVRGEVNKSGTIREFRIYPPFDLQNKTAGHHNLTVHGSFNTFSTVDVPVGLLPEGPEPPIEYVRYVNSTLWNPTPTPEIKYVDKEVIKEVVKVETVVEVEKVNYITLTEKIVGTLIFPAIIVACVVLVTLYGVWTAIRTRRIRKEWKE
jgi:hypothetical protein